MKTPQVTIIDPEVILSIQSDLKIIKAALQSLKLAPPPEDEHLIVAEFCKRVKIGNWKFRALRDKGLLRTIRIGRKYYIPAGEVQRYFNGEMQIA